jgi:hypothetical protein
MADIQLHEGKATVHRILDGPVRLQTAYGAVTVPQGHMVVTFGSGDFLMEAPLPPQAFLALFNPTDDERSELGFPAADDDTPADGDVNPPTKMTPTSTGPDAVVGVGGDFPPDRPDTLPQSPVAGSSIGPASLTPEGVYPPTDAQIRDWVDAHYAESYRERVSERLLGNRTRAADLLSRYPTTDAAANEPPAPEAVIAPGQLVDPNAQAAAPEQTAAPAPDQVQMVGTTPVDQIPGDTETTQGTEPTGPPADETGAGSFPMPTAQPGIDLAAQQAPPIAPNQASDMQPSPGEDVVVTPDEPVEKQTNVVPDAAGEQAPPTDA